MEMDGSSDIPLPQPPPAKDADEAAAAAAALSKRARKRSRYLSPPYTDTDVQEEEEGVAGEVEELPDVSAAAALSSLLAAAPCYGQGVDSAALCFLKLHRSRNRATAGGGSSNDGGNKKFPSPGGGGGGGGHTKLNLSACPAMSGPVDGSPAPALAKKKNPNEDGPMQDAAAPGQAQAADFAVNGTYAAANSAPPPERKTKKYKKWAKSAGPPPPPLLPRLPLTDIRSNLEMMIASLTATAEAAPNSPDNLVREMQGLLAKVDRKLQGCSATAAHHH